VVLGALLLGVIVLFVSCSGGDDRNDRRGQGASSQSPVTPPSASASPDDEPSFSDANPGSGPSLPAPGDIDSNQPSLGDGTNGSGTVATPGQNGDGTNQNAAIPTGATCADTEMSVIPVPAASTVKRGTPVTIRLEIKNIGTRTCNRDVGADPQEIYLDQGARKYWSSDTCSNTHGSDVKQFTPGLEREYSVTWNGRQSSKCSAGLAAGPAPIPGQYEIRGRLGTKISSPVALTIVA
jgi:hypothetical protein